MAGTVKCGRRKQQDRNQNSCCNIISNVEHPCVTENQQRGPETLRDQSETCLCRQAACTDLRNCGHCTKSKAIASTCSGNVRLRITSSMLCMSATRVAYVRRVKQSTDTSVSISHSLCQSRAIEKGTRMPSCLSLFLTASLLACASTACDTSSDQPGGLIILAVMYCSLLFHDLINEGTHKW